MPSRLPSRCEDCARPNRLLYLVAPDTDVNADVLCAECHPAATPYPDPTNP